MPELRTHAETTDAYIAEGHQNMSRLRFAGYAGLLLLAGCVSQQKYDALEARYNQLNETMSAQISAHQMPIARLQNAIKVTVNDQLLFPSGGWQMPDTAQQTIS